MAVYLVLFVLFYPLAWGLNRIAVNRFEYLVRYTFWIGSLLPILLLLLLWAPGIIVSGRIDPKLFAALVAFSPLTIVTTIASYHGTRGITA